MKKIISIKYKYCYLFLFMLLFTVRHITTTHTTVFAAKQNKTKYTVSYTDIQPEKEYSMKGFNYIKFKVDKTGTYYFECKTKNDKKLNRKTMIGFNVYQEKKIKKDFWGRLEDIYFNDDLVWQWEGSYNYGEQYIQLEKGVPYIIAIVPKMEYYDNDMQSYDACYSPKIKYNFSIKYDEYMSDWADYIKSIQE